MERVSTGITGLDGLVEGGFEKGSVVVVAGESGTGKTIFGIQFLYNGANLGESGLFISFEEKKRRTIEHMRRFGWELEKLEKERKFFVYEYGPREVDRFVSEGGAIERTIRDNKIQRIVLDSITSYAALFESEKERREAIVKLFDMLRRWNCTTILPSEAAVVTEGGEVRARFGIEYLADALIAIWSVRMGDVREMALEVIKMRGTAHSKKLSPMKITNEGIIIYPDQPFFARKF